MGGEEDEWTVVRRRGRKAHRQVDDGVDRLRTDHRDRRGVSPISSRFSSHDRRQRFSPVAYDKRDWRRSNTLPRYRSVDSHNQFREAFVNN
jgi:hypothetical protein